MFCVLTIFILYEENTCYTVFILDDYTFNKMLEMKKKKTHTQNAVYFLFLVRYYLYAFNGILYMHFL